MLARLCSESFKLGFSSMWNENFQVYTLGFEEAEVPEIKLSTFIGSWRKQGSSWKTSTSASLTAKAFDSVDHNNLWKILKEMGIPDHLTCLLRNLSASQEATVRTEHGTMDWFKIRKGIQQGCISFPCLFNLYTEYIMWNARLDESQARIKIARRNINSQQPQICSWYHSNGRKWRGTKEPLEESEKVGLKLNIQKTKIMASSPITSWQIDGETVETVTGFIFWGSKITADDEIKRHLLFGRKAMTSLDSILKSRDITLPTKVHLVKAMVFPVVMYGCES